MLAIVVDAGPALLRRWRIPRHWSSMELRNIGLRFLNQINPPNREFTTDLNTERECNENWHRTKYTNHEHDKWQCSYLCQSITFNVFNFKARNFSFYVLYEVYYFNQSILEAFYYFIYWWYIIFVILFLNLMLRYDEIRNDLLYGVVGLCYGTVWYTYYTLNFR